MNGRPVGHADVFWSGRYRRTGRAAFVLAVLCASAVPLVGQSPAASTQAVVVPIKGVISDILHDSVQRRVTEAQAAGAKTIIFEMDTPGGMVTSALDVCTLIKELPDDVHTVAWVHPQAYSAGAMISVACKEIVMSTRSSIGDCAPIMVSPVGGLQELGEAERAKAESPVLEEFADSAARNGYPALLCRAMVTVGEEVWWLEHAETKERKFANAAQKKSLIDDLEPAQREWQLVTEYIDANGGQPRPVEQPIDHASSLLTLSQSQAVAFGFARAIAGDLAALGEHLGLSAVPTYHEISGWEKFAMWLNSPLVRGILFVIMLIGGYIEFQSPGLILPGAVAVVALGIFLGAPYVAGLANIWTIILLVVGLILLALEIFVIPGFGVAGICGVLLILVAFVGTFVPAEPGSPAFSWPNLQGTWEAIKTGIIVLSSSMIIAVIGILLLARYLPELPGGRRLVLANPDAAAMALVDPHPDVALVGDIGVVVGDLRPGGQVRFGTEIVDVHSQGEYVDAGRRVQVLEHEGPRVIVRPLPDGTDKT
ncbi:MAG: ATP-dependent Clp protease proteolytic subunit [Planctomycetes bacterium]|nr:ATP-dependent Clp protease proteolytic subunit [Planctomycetota bacterium]